MAEDKYHKTDRVFQHKNVTPIEKTVISIIDDYGLIVGCEYQVIGIKTYDDNSQSYILSDGDIYEMYWFEEVGE